MASEKKQSVLNGAMMLMLAVVLVKLIGALFKIPLTDMLGLGTQILVVIERCFHHIQNASLQKNYILFYTSLLTKARSFLFHF